MQREHKSKDENQRAGRVGESPLEYGVLHTRRKTCKSVEGNV
jgi:hypothetical protein